MVAEERGEPIINLSGVLVALGPQRRELAPLIGRWLNDFQVTAPLGAPLRPMTLESANASYDNSEGPGDQFWFTLYERATMRPIGVTGLRDVDRSHRTAEFVIFIGEQDCWGRGFGTEAARLVLDYGFTALELENVMLKVFSFNERGRRAYLRAGFREIGRRRLAHRLAGRAHDVIYMDCIAAEFDSPVLRGMLGA